MLLRNSQEKQKKKKTLQTRRVLIDLFLGFKSLL